MVRIITGKIARMTKAKLHPLEKEKAIPAMVIDSPRMMVPMFSPRAFYIARHSLPKRAASS